MSFTQLADAAYALDVEEDAWVRDLCARTRPLLDAGSGVFAYSYLLTGDRIRLDAVVVEGTAAANGIWDSLNDWGARNQALVAALYRSRPVQIVSFASVARFSGAARRELSATFEPHGIRDMLAFVAHHRTGSGVILTVPLARSHGPSRALERTFSDVGSALAAITHLRRKRCAARACAVLSPSERAVASLLIAGRSDKEIACELAMAMSTVSTLAHRIRKKLGCDAGGEWLHLAEPDAEAALARRRQIFATLTPAERDVAVELAAGARYADLARERGCTERTIAAQASSIFRKSGFRGRRALAAALLGGLEPPSRENDDGATP